MNTGVEWLFDLLVTLTEKERTRVLMIIWRNRQIRNDTLRDKVPAPVEATRKFLLSYMSSLEQIKLNDGRYLVKEKVLH